MIEMNILCRQSNLGLFSSMLLMFEAISKNEKLIYFNTELK